MPAASQAAAFYRQVADHGVVWTIRDAGGYPAPINSDGARAQPFWPSSSRVERIIASVPAYKGFLAVEISLDVFLDRWVPGMARDGILVGVNWSGDRAAGYDIAPEQVAENIRGASRGGP
jgi:hypothetical protein